MKTPWWFLHKTPVSLILWPVSMIYYAAARMVYFMRKIRAYKSRRAVICVGNILAGGVGKTPIVCEIAKFLDAPVVMRGYKKSAATNGAGDEALMLSRTGLQVHTGHRLANVRLLDAQDDRTPIVMDDGFQNPRVAKDISILVFDGRIGVGNGFILPAGPLREPMRAARRADAIIVIRAPRGVKSRRMKFPDGVPVFYAENTTVSPYGAGVPVVAFAGIGYPKKFFSALPNVVARRAFADHYQYTDDDIARLRALAGRHGAKLVTTEKDWVRLPAPVRDEIKYAELHTKIDSEFFTWLRGKLDADNKK